LPDHRDLALTLDPSATDVHRLSLDIFLWRQTQLYEPLLQCRQAGLGVLAETPLELPRLPEFSELPGFLTPSGQIDLRQLRGGDGL
jgi:hypothetical protein